MMRHALLALLVLYDIQAHITDQPSFADRLNHIYEKLEKFTIAPTKKINSKLYAKLDRLNSLTPGEITDEDEELLSAMQMWGTISDDQLKGVVQEFQRLKEEDKSERGDEYSDGDWNDDDLDYINDDGEEWGDPIDEETSSTSRPIIGVTPSAFTRLDSYRHTIVSAVDPIAATNERPRILDDSHATAHERVSLRKAAIANVRNVVKSGNCLVPQPRWFFVRKLAPAADTVYMPPCVQLHRCAPDSGCCYDEAEVCAPVEGKYVAIPFLLTKTDKNLTAARILFFNHTRCACVSRDTLQSTMRTRIEQREDRREDRTERRDERREESIERDERREDSGDTERQNDWREPTEEPILKKDEDQTAPPQLRRCTCPALFRNRIKDGICSCVCEWPDTTRKRNCLSLARGKEHFGLRDRVCLERGDCTTPSCEYGAYDRSIGRCPYRRVKRRYNSRRYHRV